MADGRLAALRLYRYNACVRLLRITATALSASIGLAALPLLSLAGDVNLRNADTLALLTSRNVLVAGAGSLASGKAPATIVIELQKGDLSSGAQLQLSLSPIAVSPGEKYVVVVSAAAPKSKEGAPELGSFSFFPPPRQGETREFYVDLPTQSTKPMPDRRRVALSVSLVPIDPNRTLNDSSVRIVGARVVHG
jgi:hypothetical protein